MKESDDQTKQAIAETRSAEFAAPEAMNELTVSVQTFLDDILQAVSRYATREHSRAVREGLAKREAQDTEQHDNGHEGEPS